MAKMETAMSDDKERKIQSRAHELWEKEGRPEGRHLEHWLEAEREHSGSEGSGESGQQNEGEGNRTAAKAYNAHVEETVKSGTVGSKAKAAKKAVEGPERAELEDAEAVGKSHAKGEDPALSKKKA